MGRNSRKKEQKYRIAIIGEGETEWHYFDSLRTKKKYNFQVSPELPKHSDYESIFQTAKKLANDGYDEIFCVLDIDVFNDGNKRQKYENQKKKLLKDYTNIKIFESMPCIELWFLLHFKSYSTKIYNTCDELLLDLKKYIPNYEKKETYFRQTNLYTMLAETGDLQQAKASVSKLRIERDAQENPLFPFSELDLILSSLDTRGN